MGRAVLIMFVAMSLIPAGDSAGKLLTGTFDAAPEFVAWSRFALGALMVLPFLRPGTWPLLRDPRVWLRAAAIAGGITCIQFALQSADIATVFAAFFIGPLVSYFLAAVFLREPVTLTRTALIVLGFLGVLVVVRPGMGGEPGLIWAVVAGLCYGSFLTMSRWLSGIGTPLALTFSQLAISALLLLPIGALNLPNLTAPVVGLTLTSALCSMAGNLLLLYAYRVVDAARLAPLVYFQLIAAVGLGWAVFGDLPDPATWAGMTLIIGAGLLSTRLR
ncbi:MAG: DMT family transporter [Pseudomonadota bacterium]